MLSRSSFLFPLAAVALFAGACQEYALAPLPGNYVGKVFYSVDLNNYDGDALNSSADAAPYTLTISNPANNQERATVEIRQMGGEGLNIKENIEYGTLETFDMPRWDAEDSFLGNRSVHIESTVPVAVHQFNPANNVGVYSNDASLLLPEVALGTRYRAACWPQGTVPSLLGKADYVTIVGTAAATTVTVTPTADVRAGTSVPATSAGTPLTVTLDQGGVLQLEGDNTSTGVSDLTGSLIEASAPVVVFSGNECAEIPADYDACDHVEEQLLPVEAWGTHYVAAKFSPRGAETDVYRVMADQDGTTVEVSPTLDGFPATLDGGEYLEFDTDQDFVLSASGPVAMVQYMTGSTWGEADVGDPAMVVLVPEEQYLAEYMFLTPSGYQADYANIIARAGAEVTIDEQPVEASLWTDVGSGEFAVARARLEPGIHHLVSDQDVGLVVYGYDQEVSYAYPGGANLGGEE